MSEERAIEWLMPLPVLLPFLSAAATLVLSRHPRAQRVLSIGALALGTPVAFSLRLLPARHGSSALQVGGWDSQIGIPVASDGLAAMMLFIAYVVLLSVMVDAVGQGIRGGDEPQPVSVFQPTYLVMAAGISNAFL